MYNYAEVSAPAGMFALLKPQFSLYKHFGRCSRCTLLLTGAGTRGGGWFRVKALNMSDLILSQRTRHPLSRVRARALYFAIRINISSPAAAQDLRAERLINASYDESRAPGLSDSHSTRLSVIYRSDSRVCIQATRASGFPAVSRHRFDLVLFSARFETSLGICLSREIFFTR